MLELLDLNDDTVIAIDGTVHEVIGVDNSQLNIGISKIFIQKEL